MVNVLAFVCVIAIGPFLIVVTADSDQGSNLAGPGENETAGIDVTPTSTSPGDKFSRLKVQESNEAADGHASSDNGDKDYDVSTTEEPGRRRAGKLDEDKEESNPKCPSPPEIEGAITPRLENNKHPVGATMTYSCNFGYVSRNSINHISVCTVNESTGEAEWTVPEVTCIPRSCGDPGHLNNGRRIGNLFTFPNKVEYECDEGYKLRGLTARYCQAGGEWSGRLPICEQIYCTVPPDPVNGRVKYSSLEYGTELRYECNIGFIVQKHQPRVCIQDGSWSNEEPECIEAKCEEPLPPEHGSVQLSGDPKVGSLATYTCDAGMMLFGASTTKCLISGHWTFDPPKCLSFCSVPDIENGEVGQMQIRAISRWRSSEEFKKFFAGEPVKPNETVLLRCKEGFLPTEDSTVFENNQAQMTCNDGTWSKVLECKQTSCLEDPPKMKDGRAVTSNRAHGHTIWYSCNRKNDFKVKGNVTCYFGTWIGIVPKCLNSPCFRTNLTYNGLEIPPEDHFASTESFDIVCKHGFRKSTSATKITCNRGTWDIKENPCVEDISGSCDRNQLNYPGLEKPSQEYFSNFQSFSIKCKNGFEKSALKMIVTCVSGQWDLTENPCTQDLSNSCDTNQLNYPGLEKPSQDAFSNFENFFIKCENGFEKSTSKRIISCVNGQWDMNENPCIKAGNHERIVPTARPSGFAETIQHSLSSVTSTEPTSKNQQSSECVCNFDYVSSLVIARVGHKVLKTGDNVKQGKVVYFQCVHQNMVLTWANGLRIYKGANITCRTCERWQSERLPSCRTHRKGDPLLMVDEKVKILPHGVAEIQKGQSVNFACTSTWIHPKWYSELRLPMLFAESYDSVGNTRYYAILKITDSKKSHSGSYQCIIEDEYGNNIASINMELNVRDPEIRCNALLDNQGMFRIEYDNDRKVNSNAYFTCKSGTQRVVGTSVRTCLSNGRWSHSYPTCEEYVSCSTFPESPDLQVVYNNGVSVGSTASFTCLPPNRLVGNGHTVCQNNGTWSNPAPSCSEPQCGIYELSTSVPSGVVPDMTFATGEYMSPGSEMQLECENDLILTGDSKAMCKHDGKWQLGTFQCVSGCFLKTDPSSHLLIEPKQQVYRFGEFVLLSCPSGEVMTSDVERLMCLGKAWSHDIPDCKTID